MNADIDGAARIIREAADYDWDWSEDDLERFSSIVGWDAQIRPSSGATMVTHLGVQEPFAYAWTDGDVKDISIRFTDIADDDNMQHRAKLNDYFAEMSNRAISILGHPTSSKFGSIPNMRWWTDKVLIELAGYPGGTCIRLVNPEYQRWVDTIDDPSVLSRKFVGGIRMVGCQPRSSHWN